MPDSLPERPDLSQLRRRAKELRDAARRGDPAALERFARHHPSAPQDAAGLAAAQLVLARELGFASWPALKAAAPMTLLWSPMQIQGASFFSMKTRGCASSP